VPVGGTIGTMRAVFALAVLVLAASCGGGTSTPTTATAVPSTDLTPGAYTLTLSQGSVSVCQNGICTSITACTGNALTDVALPVTLSRDGDRVTVTPVAPGDSLRMVLQESASSLSGTVSGAASTGSGVTVAASGSLVGVISSIRGAGAEGQLQGDLVIAGASCVGTTKGWALSTR